MKKEFSFIEKFGFKNVVLFCIFIILIEFFRLVRSNGGGLNIDFSDIWLNSSIGLLLIAMSILTIKYNEEKKGVMAIGTSLIISPLAIFFKKPLFLSFSILVETYAIYCFWRVREINHHKGNLNLSKKSILIFIFLGLTIPALLLWLIGIIQK